MSESGESRSWWSKAILAVAVIGAALLPVGALGSRLGLWPFTVGFLMLAAGAMLASIGLVTGIVGIVTAHRRRRAADKPAVYVGTVLSAVVLAFLSQGFLQATSVPPIHDISTDVVDPPRFDRVVALRGENANPLAYDAEKLAPLQREAYPGVETLRTDLDAEAALQRAAAVLESMGLEIVAVDTGAGRVEATDTTFWFGFKDDVVVRVRPVGTGALVDVRSVSRVGESDLGKNAERIGSFLDAFRSAS